MGNKILEVLREHPTGLRLREIAMYLRVNRFSIIRELDELHKAGLVCGRQNDDHANGEYYIIWSAVEVKQMTIEHRPYNKNYPYAIYGSCGDVICTDENGLKKLQEEIKKILDK